MALRPWYDVIKPREDLRMGRPLDASEFAVHLDQVRDKRAPDVYQNPEQFFRYTYMTKNLTELAAGVVRRLSGEKTETSAVYNMTTQFGGGKTHSLTLLYHLAEHGVAANNWAGVRVILEKAGISSVPQAATAVFVGTEFDSISGRGGDDGTPNRKTPWGEIAYQLGGEAALDVLAEHEQQMTAPAGDVIRKFLPSDRPVLILMDELMNYISRSRKSGMAGQFYNFLHNLSEEARGRDNLVLVVSIPASELEMTAEDQSDYERVKKLLDRLGKAVLMSSESETSEIIRRRLFEWDERAIGQDGKVLLSKDAIETCKAYAAWVREHEQQLPQWFPLDNPQEAFQATYPFHPMVFSVFERKWQALPRFQRTRGVLRLLALWVSQAYQEGYKGAQKDAMIGLGTAPLDDPLFRAAMLEQLGSDERLEAAVTTDITGKKDAHAVRLDAEASPQIKKMRLHRKVATSIFFESNGGSLRAEATVPEVRLAVAEPGLDIGYVETVLESLTDACYYLALEHNRYRFSLTPNLNKLLADRRANIRPERVEDAVRTEIQKALPAKHGVERTFFPQKSSDISDRPALTLVVMAPEQSMQETGLLQQLDGMTREYGTSARTFKNALIWCVADSPTMMREEAKKLLAWEDIAAEDISQLDAGQQRQLTENLKRAQRDLVESLWRSYKHVLFLGKDNQLRHIDLGLVNSSAAEDLLTLIINRLRQEDEVVDGISPVRLVQNWPPAFVEWSTRLVRDAFYASPQFPRLLKADSIRETISRGVVNGLIAYIGKKPNGTYEPFFFEQSIAPAEVEIAEDMYIITADTARAFKQKKVKKTPVLESITVAPVSIEAQPGATVQFSIQGYDEDGDQMDISQQVQWTSDGGTISSAGLFIAGNAEGSFTVKATANWIDGIAQVVISKKAVVPPPPPPPLPPQGIRSISWTGEIPPQRWTNFYMKVLTRFAKDSALKVTITMDATPATGVTQQEIEETKAALRELGLPDDIQTNG